MSLFDEFRILDKIASPLNYSGGKYRLLSQILPFFPDHFTGFVDLFCGGCNVGINVDADWVIFNDQNSELVHLFQLFKRLRKEDVFSRLKEIINQYGLSESSQFGYDYYHCNSAAGLAGYNKEPFLRLREDFNLMTERNDDFYLTLYVLIVYSFNNQIRFNGKGEFNLPVGKRDFNRQMREKLSSFIQRLWKKKLLGPIA